jgi:uncharacterized protein (TIGR04255 family)
MSPINVHQHYRHAPITEALIDIQVTLPDANNIEILKTLRGDQESSYPEVQQQYIGKLEIQPGLKFDSVSEHQQLGFTFVSTEKQKLIQARLNGFTFNWLAPYSTWEEFRDEARFWWDRYRQAVQPISINRLAVRYINRMKIPYVAAELSSYISTYPSVSDALPENSLNGYFMRLSLPQPDMQATLVLSQVLEAVESGQGVAVILDIDLFKDQDLPNEEAAIWDYFELLRARKNLVFESSITDSMRELLNQ